MGSDFNEVGQDMADLVVVTCSQTSRREEVGPVTLRGEHCKERNKWPWGRMHGS